jgi:phosphatidylglycerol:prolipoprotein diacylglycerol transferase
MRLPIIRTLDVFMPALALAQGFGRIGCFFNGCCYGHATEAWCGVRFPFAVERLHPAQLYESGFCFLLFLFLARFDVSKKRLDGETAFLYFLLYPLGRFVIEYFRADTLRLWFDWTLAQWVSLALIGAALVFFYPRISSRHGA